MIDKVHCSWCNATGDASRRFHANVFTIQCVICPKIFKTGFKHRKTCSPICSAKLVALRKAA